MIQSRQTIRLQAEAAAENHPQENPYLDCPESHQEWKAAYDKRVKELDLECAV